MKKVKPLVLPAREARQFDGVRIVDHEFKRYKATGDGAVVVRLRRTRTVDGVMEDAPGDDLRIRIEISASSLSDTNTRIHKALKILLDHAIDAAIEKGLVEEDTPP